MLNSIKVRITKKPRAPELMIDTSIVDDYRKDTNISLFDHPTQIEQVESSISYDIVNEPVKPPKRQRVTTPEGN